MYIRITTPTHSPRILWTALGVAAVVPTAARKRIVATLELAGDLLVGGSPPRHQHHMEPGQAEDRYRQQGDDRHQDHSTKRKQRRNVNAWPG